MQRSKCKRCVGSRLKEVIAAEMTDTLDGDGTNTPLDEQPEDDESGDGGLP